MINGPVSEAARRCRVQGREKPLWACTWTGAYRAKVRPELGPWDGWEHTSRVGEKVALHAATAKASFSLKPRRKQGRLHGSRQWGQRKVDSWACLPVTWPLDMGGSECLCQHWGEMKK